MCGLREEASSEEFLSLFHSVPVSQWNNIKATWWFVTCLLSPGKERVRQGTNVYIIPLVSLYNNCIFDVPTLVQTTFSIDFCCNHKVGNKA